MKVCNDHDYCYIEMPNESNKILKYNYGEKSLKAPFIDYTELECLLEKMHSCQNNFAKSNTEKKQQKTKYRPSGYSIFRISLFDPTKKKLDCYKDEDCMESFCKDLREHTMKRLTMKKKK